MKLNEINMTKYTAYVLDQGSREALTTKFPPKYPKFIGHHVTVEFGVPDDTEAPPDAHVKVIGYIDSGDGLEALAVSVNGSARRPDGKVYHITWSLDPAKYSPVDSNALLADKRFTLIRSIPVATKPEVL